jgi:hypothetical protein
MDLPLDFRELLEEFAREGVEYLIVGGYAVAFHARPRATKDLDILLGAAAGNLDRAAAALARFGAPDNVVAATRAMRESDIVYLGQPRCESICSGRLMGSQPKQPSRRRWLVAGATSTFASSPLTISSRTSGRRVGRRISPTSSSWSASARAAGRSGRLNSALQTELGPVASPPRMLLPDDQFSDQRWHPSLAWRSRGSRSGRRRDRRAP